MLASRYFDTYCLTLSASFACLLIWTSRFVPIDRRLGPTALVCLWVFVGTQWATNYFVQHTSSSTWSGWRDSMAQQETTVRDYLESHDKTLLTTNPIPYPDPVRA